LAGRPGDRQLHLRAGLEHAADGGVFEGQAGRDAGDQCPGDDHRGGGGTGRQPGRHRHAPARPRGGLGRRPRSAGAGRHGAGRAVIRQLRWMRALRSKSGGMVEAVTSSTAANSATAASSSLKRRKLFEKYSTPPGASRMTAARSSRTWAAWTSKSPARLELENVGGSQNTRSYWARSASSHASASACTSRWRSPPMPLAARLSAHHCRYVPDRSTVVVVRARPTAAWMVAAPV